MDISKFGLEMLKKPNVIGFSHNLEPRVYERTGRINEDEWCIRIHVSRKVPIGDLRLKDLLPETYQDIPIDVIAIGPVSIPLPGKNDAAIEPKQMAKTDLTRPVIQAISIGNESITAGTNSWPMEGPDNEIFQSTNAHVAVPDVSLAPDKVQEKRIMQPGPYDIAQGENLEDYIAGEYAWHKQLFPLGASDCGVANGACKVANALAYLFQRKTRLVPIVQEVNYIDFAVWRPSVDWNAKFFEDEFRPTHYVGIGFAGSDTVGLVCKASRIAAEGYKPLDRPIRQAVTGDLVHKSGRTSCYSTAVIQSESVYQMVSYGSFYVAFDDLLMTSKLLEPGDSGSSVWFWES